jgi:hypothetical protein
MDRMIQWECLHELNAFRLLDADAAVTASGIIHAFI